MITIAERTGPMCNTLTDEISECVISAANTTISIFAFVHLPMPSFPALSVHNIIQFFF